MAKTTETMTKDKEAAERYVRNVVVSDFGQQIDDETLNKVVKKVLRSVPPYPKVDELRS